MNKTLEVLNRGTVKRAIKKRKHPVRTMTIRGFAFKRNTDPNLYETFFALQRARLGLKHWCVVVIEYDKTDLFVFAQTCVQCDQGMVPLFKPCLVKIPDRSLRSIVQVIKMMTAKPLAYIKIKFWVYMGRRYISVVDEYYCQYGRLMPTRRLMRNYCGRDKTIKLNLTAIVIDIVNFTFFNADHIAMLAEKCNLSPRPPLTGVSTMCHLDHSAYMRYSISIDRWEFESCVKYFVGGFLRSGRVSAGAIECGRNATTSNQISPSFRVVSMVVQLCYNNGCARNYISANQAQRTIVCLGGKLHISNNGQDMLLYYNGRELKIVVSFGVPRTTMNLCIF